MDCYKIIDLFYFTLNLAHRADKVFLIANKALISSAVSEEEKRKYQSNIENSEKSVRKLSDFSGLNSKNLTVTIADAFLWFVSATIQSAMKKKPEMVKSGESVRIEGIFDYRNKRELINYLIDKKVNSLSYGGVSSIERFIRGSMGVEMFQNDDARELMKIFVEVRNVHVHNRGFVNRVFLGRAKQHDKFRFVEGTRAHLDFNELVILTRVCVQTAIDLDTKICTKFNIKRKRYSTWKKNATASKTNSAMEG